MDLNKPPKSRRDTMTAEQRKDLDILALVTARYHQRNLRMARGLQIGFRKLEAQDNDNPEVGLPQVRK